MTEPRGFVRPGRHRLNHVYLITGDGSTPDDDQEVVIAFTDAWGERVVRALNLLEEQESAAATITGVDAKRVQARHRIADAALARADRLGKTIACQSLDLRRHATCIGVRATTNGGLGCLCRCHDGQDPGQFTEGAEREGVVA